LSPPNASPHPARDFRSHQPDFHHSSSSTSENQNQQTKKEMSHFTTIQTEVRDLEALNDACVEMGLQLLKDIPCRGYAGSQRKADHVIQLNGPYDIAVDPQEGGRYGFTTDWWAGHVEHEVGPGYGRLLQTYGIHKTMRTARTRGLRTTRSLQADGSVLLTLQGGAL